MHLLEFSEADEQGQEIREYKRLTHFFFPIKDNVLRPVRYCRLESYKFLSSVDEKWETVGEVRFYHSTNDQSLITKIRLIRKYTSQTLKTVFSFSASLSCQHISQKPCCIETVVGV